MAFDILITNMQNDDKTILKIYFVTHTLQNSHIKTIVNLKAV